MAKKFHIATVEMIGPISSIGKKSIVEEKLFYSILKSKVSELTQKQPEKFSEVYEEAKTHLEKYTALSIKDIWFRVSGN